MSDNTAMFDALLDEVKSIADSDGDMPGTAKAHAVCDLLRDCVPHYDWVGFYLVASEGSPDSPRELVLGPFAGEPTDHVRIPFGRGICGQAAEREETFVVQDVSKETNYLSCSVHVKSEIVLPMFRDGVLVGELDIDSHTLAPFTRADQKFLEAVCEVAAKLF